MDARRGGRGRTGSKGRRAPSVAVGAALMGLALGGCDSLLDVSLPGETEAGALDDPSYSELLVVSAQGDFECAYSKWVFNSGHLAGELMGGSGALLMIPAITRDVQSHHTGYGEGDCDDTEALYTPLSTARFVAEDAFERISGYTDAEVAGRTELLGRAALYAGFSYAVFGEGFCAAAFDLGPARTPAEIFALAEERFTTAIELATEAGDDETLNAALVGRARVRLPLGKAAAAAEDARRVPAGFEFFVTRSNADDTRQNDIYMSLNRSRNHSIDPQYWDVAWMGVADPRVELIDTGELASNGRTPLWLQTKYLTEDAPIRLASHVEAQLVIAEVEGGQVAVDIINELHEAAGIPPFASSDADEIRQHVIEERRREFFLEGRRMGDLRRFGGFAEAASHGERNPFTEFRYGDTECFPIPDVERRNNPNLS